MRTARKIITLAAAAVAVILSVIWFSVVAANRESPTRSTAESDQLADIERRIEKLENAPLFSVVNQQRKTIFAVYSQIPRTKGKDLANVAIFYNPDGRPVAFIRAYSDGGSFETYSYPGNSAVLLESGDGSWNGFRLVERSTDQNGLTKEVERIALGEGDETEEGKARNYSLRFLTESDKIVAGIGVSRAGSGTMVIGDAKGNKRVSMLIAEEGKGRMGLFNADDKAVLTFGESLGNTGGSLVIGNAGSDPMVKMGSNDNLYGIVLAYPIGIPYVPRSGLPGSYFVGCRAGSKICTMPQ